MGFVPHHGLWSFLRFYTTIDLRAEEYSYDSHHLQASGQEARFIVAASMVLEAGLLAGVESLWAGYLCGKRPSMAPILKPKP